MIKDDDGCHDADDDVFLLGVSGLRAVRPSEVSLLLPVVEADPGVLFDEC